MKSRKREDQYADCEETHISSALCHTGLISHRLGKLMTNDEIKEMFFKNMSERAGSALEEEMEYLGPVRVKDVEAAQVRIIAKARALEESGEIVIPGRGGDSDFIT